MAAEISLPVLVRVGGFPEAHFGDLTLELEATAEEGELTLGMTEYRTKLAAFLRAAADVVERPPEDDEEVDDAAS